MRRYSHEMPPEVERRVRDIDGIDDIDDISKNVYESLPKFPMTALPSAVRGLVDEASAAIGCAPELLALPALAALGAAIGTRLPIPARKRRWRYPPRWSRSTASSAG